jgi:hypothetical protein
MWPGRSSCREQLLDLCGRWDAARDDDLVVDEECGGGHHAPGDDLAGVGDLVDLDLPSTVDPQIDKTSCRTDGGVMDLSSPPARCCC